MVDFIPINIFPVNQMLFQQIVKCANNGSFKVNNSLLSVILHVVPKKVIRTRNTSTNTYCKFITANNLPIQINTYSIEKITSCPAAVVSAFLLFLKEIL